MSDLITTTSEIIQTAANGSVGLAVSSTLGAAGGVLAVAGKVVVGGLVRRGMDDLFERYAKAKEAKSIPPDFEQTDHGAALLQEALNALCQGIDEERAEAVKKVFLGLAMDSVEESFKKMEQLEVMRVACDLNMWEVAAINMLDRYRLERFDEEIGRQWEFEKDSSKKHMIAKNTEKGGAYIQDFDDWKREFCGDKTLFIRLRDATEVLHRKHVAIYGSSSSMEIGRNAKFMRQGNFTDFGWKLATYLRT